MNIVQNTSRTAVLPPPKNLKANSRKGFTLAEILISLLILGVIASLTIPSLIQNTHKKEEVVKIKKGISTISQALAMNYALTGQDYTDLIQGNIVQDPNSFNNSGYIAMLKKRLSIVEISQSFDEVYFLTQDGLGYKTWGINNSELFFKVYTNPKTDDGVNSWWNDIYNCNGNNLCGVYDFKCSMRGECVTDGYTAAIISAKDPSKCRWNGETYTCD